MNREESQKISLELDQFHLMIGRISSQYSFIDFLINSTIWKLADLDPKVGACMTSQIISTSSRIRVIIHLLGLREDSDVFTREAKKLMDSNYSIAEMRNRIVHDPLLSNADHEGGVSSLRVFSDNKSINLDNPLLSLEEMNNFLNKISGQMRLFAEFYKRIVIWLEESKPKWREQPMVITMGDIEYVE